MSKNFPPNFFSGSEPVALVAGGAGFVGSHVCKALLEKNVKVICVDNWQTGVRENISDFANNENFFLLEQDAAKPLTGITKLRYVLHFAGIEACLNNEVVSMEDVEANSHGTKNLLDLAGEKDARFLLASTLGECQIKSFADGLAKEYSEKKNVDVRIVRMGDVYGPKMMLAPKNPIAKLLKQEVYKEPIKITESTKLAIFPIFIDDVVSGIEKALFSAKPKDVVTTLAGPKTSLFTFGQNLEEPGLAKTIRWLKEHTERVPHQKEKKREEFWKEEKSKKRSSRFFGKLRLVFLAILLFLAWFVFLPPVSLLVGGFALKLTRDSAFSADEQKVVLWGRIAQVSLSLAQNGFGKWGYVPLVKNESGRLANSAAALNRLGQILQTTTAVARQAKILGSSIVKDENLDIEKESGDLALDLRALEKQLAFFETETEDIIQIPGLVTPIPKKEEIASLRGAVSAAGSLVAQLPELLGTKEKKTYLVLFQNNMELRPTGGFIGSFGLLTFEKGRLINTEVQDVYSADGQLKGHVEPPAPIKEHMGQKAWFLRDSNWSPDFPTSGKQAAWFLEQELGTKANGVIAIDLEFVKELVGETGSITLPDFNQTVNGNNFYEVTQKEAEENFFPGSRAKKDFLTALTRALLNRTTGDPGSFLLPAARVAFTQLEERHMAIWTDNGNVNEVFGQRGWDGAIEDVACSKNCVADYLQVVDSNLGINKSNYFLDRAYSLETTLGEGRVGHKLAINYNNKSQAGVWPGGEYKNYLRIFAPKDSKAILATIINPKTGESAELDIDIDTDKQSLPLRGKEKDKEVFGMILTVPAGEARQVVVLWDTPVSPVVSRGGQEMVFLWQKQAGTGKDLVSLRVNIPSGTGIAASPEPSLTQAGSASYNTTLARDLLVNLTWQPKR